MAREVNDPERVLEIYHALVPTLETDARISLDRELAKWFLTLIHRRLRTGDDSDRCRSTGVADSPRSSPQRWRGPAFGPLCPPCDEVSDFVRAARSLRWSGRSLPEVLDGWHSASHAPSAASTPITSPPFERIDSPIREHEGSINPDGSKLLGHPRPPSLTGPEMSARDE